MSKQPQLPLDETLNKKLTAEQKLRLNYLINELAQLGETANLTYAFNNKAYNKAIHHADPLHTPENSITSNANFIDYITQFELTEADLPILRVMLESDKLYFAKDSKTYINLHVAVALSQLGHEASIPLLINQVHKRDICDDDWIGELYPFVLASFGEALLKYAKLAYPLSKDTYVRGVLDEAVRLVATQNPDLKQQVIAILAEWLGDFMQQAKDNNALLINDLCELKAVEQLPLIKQAFDTKKVDLSHMGDYEEVEILMGVKTERSTPKPEFWDDEDRERFEAFEFMTRLLEEDGTLHTKQSKISPVIDAIRTSPKSVIK